MKTKIVIGDDVSDEVKKKIELAAKEAEQKIQKILDKEEEEAKYFRATMEVHPKHKDYLFFKEEKDEICAIPVQSVEIVGEVKNEIVFYLWSSEKGKHVHIVTDFASSAEAVKWLEENFNVRFAGFATEDVGMRYLPLGEYQFLAWSDKVGISRPKRSSSTLLTVESLDTAMDKLLT